MNTNTNRIAPHKSKTALIAVDVQNDFLPGGALGVPEGDAVVDPLVEIAREADVVIASRDWHPADHSSFADQGGIWPAHCIAGEHGSRLHPKIEGIADHVIDKGAVKDKEAYSAFDGTGLAEKLKSLGVTRVIVGGLATDYCVKATALDARAAGFQTEVALEAARGVNVTPGDSQKAVEEMENAGIPALRGKVAP